MIVVERGILEELGTGNVYQQEPLCLKDRCVHQGMNYLKNTLQSCCGNPFGNHKLKVVVNGKTREP
jgi:hypothetical protein